MCHVADTSPWRPLAASTAPAQRQLLQLGDAAHTARSDYGPGSSPQFAHTSVPVVCSGRWSPEMLCVQLELVLHTASTVSLQETRAKGDQQQGLDSCSV